MPMHALLLHPVYGKCQNQIYELAPTNTYISPGCDYWCEVISIGFFVIVFSQLGTHIIIQLSLMPTVFLADVLLQCFYRYYEFYTFKKR